MSRKGNQRTLDILVGWLLVFAVLGGAYFLCTHGHGEVVAGILFAMFIIFLLSLT